MKIRKALPSAARCYPIQLSALLTRRWGSSLALSCAIVFTSYSHAQSTFGSIRGTVQDATGAPIPGALVTVHSMDEKVDRTAKSDSSGEFVVENLKAGHYSVIVHDEGFTDSTIASVSLEARQQLRIPVTLSVQSGATTVQVMAGPDQINTENATLSDSKDNQQITQLPVNNRATTTSPLVCCPGNTRT
jgi:Carboxypeptidase regulatory-like domain